MQWEGRDESLPLPYLSREVDQYYSVILAAGALFTSTYAVCVTGLVVKNTATYWTGFDQAEILILIQIGGSGVVSVATF